MLEVADSLLMSFFIANYLDVIGCKISEHETKKNTYKKLLILILQIFWHVPINQMKSGPTC